MVTRTASAGPAHISRWPEWRELEARGAAPAPAHTQAPTPRVHPWRRGSVEWWQGAGCPWSRRGLAMNGHWAAAASGYVPLRGRPALDTTGPATSSHVTVGQACPPWPRPPPTPWPPSHLSHPGWASILSWRLR